MSKKSRIIIAIAWAICALLALSVLFDDFIPTTVFLGILAFSGIAILLAVIYKFIFIAIAYYKKQ